MSVISEYPAFTHKTGPAGGVFGHEKHEKMSNQRYGMGFTHKDFSFLMSK